MRSFMPIHFFVFKIRTIENGLADPKRFQDFRETGPRRRVPTFDGNLLEYCALVRAFETVIEDKEPDYACRLYYLEQHTAGSTK